MTFEVKLSFLLIFKIKIKHKVEAMMKDWNRNGNRSSYMNRFHQIWTVDVFHHAPLIHGIQKFLFVCLFVCFCVWVCVMSSLLYSIRVFRNLGWKVIKSSFGVIVQICLRRFFVYIIRQIVMKLGWRDPWPQDLSGIRNFWSEVILWSLASIWGQIFKML